MTFDLTPDQEKIPKKPFTGKKLKKPSGGPQGASLSGMDR